MRVIWREGVNHTKSPLKRDVVADTGKGDTLIELHSDYGSSIQSISLSGAAEVAGVPTTTVVQLSFREVTRIIKLYNEGKQTNVELKN